MVVELVERSKCRSCLKELSKPEIEANTGYCEECYLEMVDNEVDVSSFINHSLRDPQSAFDWTNRTCFKFYE